MLSTTGCSLCDELLDVLITHPLAQGVQLTIVDIVDDDALFAEYGASIPVLKVGDAEFRQGKTEPALSNWLTKHISRE